MPICDSVKFLPIQNRSREDRIQVSTLLVEWQVSTSDKVVLAVGLLQCLKTISAVNRGIKRYEFRSQLLLINIAMLLKVHQCFIYCLLNIVLADAKFFIEFLYCRKSRGI